MATLLGGVNKQKFKVNHKNLFFFYLMVLFCYAVGESGVVRWASNGSLRESHNISAFISGSEVFYQKVLCLLFYKSKEKLHL